MSGWGTEPTVCSSGLSDTFGFVESGVPHPYLAHPVDAGCRMALTPRRRSPVPIARQVVCGWGEWEDAHPVLPRQTLAPRGDPFS